MAPPDPPAVYTVRASAGGAVSTKRAASSAVASAAGTVTLTPPALAGAHTFLLAPLSLRVPPLLDSAAELDAVLDAHPDAQLVVVHVDASAPDPVESELVVHPACSSLVGPDTIVRAHLDDVLLVELVLRDAFRAPAPVASASAAGIVTLAPTHGEGMLLLRLVADVSGDFEIFATIGGVPLATPPVVVSIVPGPLSPPHCAFWMLEAADEVTAGSQVLVAARATDAAGNVFSPLAQHPRVAAEVLGRLEVSATTTARNGRSQSLVAVPLSPSSDFAKQHPQTFVFALTPTLAGTLTLSARIDKAQAAVEPPTTVSIVADKAVPCSGSVVGDGLAAAVVNRVASVELALHDRFGNVAPLPSDTPLPLAITFSPLRSATLPPLPPLAVRTVASVDTLTASRRTDRSSVEVCVERSPNASTVLLAYRCLAAGEFEVELVLGGIPMFATPLVVELAVAPESLRFRSASLAARASPAPLSPKRGASVPLLAADPSPYALDFEPALSFAALDNLGPQLAGAVVAVELPFVDAFGNKLDAELPASWAVAQVAILDDTMNRLDRVSFGLADRCLLVKFARAAAGSIKAHLEVVLSSGIVLRHTFALRVVAGALDPSHCVVATASSAPQTVVLSLGDAFGNALAVEADGELRASLMKRLHATLPAPLRLSPWAPTSVPGVLAASYRLAESPATLPDAPELGLHIDGVPAVGSPLAIALAAASLDPAASLFQLAPQPPELVAGQTVSFELSGLDTAGNVADVAAPAYGVAIKVECPDGSSLQPQLQAGAVYGRAEGHFTTAVAGRYAVHASVEGVPLPDSPLVLDVVPAPVHRMIWALPADVASGGLPAGDELVVVATFRDTFDNELPDASSVSVAGTLIAMEDGSEVGG
ncbi:uncharacterized protein AMSG_00237 [Thecamonas trahens ATCC 50062]|uniref:Uncharacterized protein n=1 Tax=Thecamonas trahens ATCC 50062 TaxID=461836 RepID=A0A0L0D183_THETB|nr:hypothetical protein AMSG_00237 [Thecamonas trahens ATCC 50062]KNC46119.1 hypothetical protein AMSG_00237 [Thecamonas trahens ATCC 50062]|eukprot:XP_013763096.1 hypothetical protein AMSG_00237 [Thecamonas trahens ATCC 50062]